MANERAYWLAWSRIKGVGPILLKRIYEQFGSLIDAWNAPTDALQQVEGIGIGLSQSLAQQRHSLDPEALLQSHEAASPQFWTPADAAYPALLFAIPDPPPVLYYRGRIDLLERVQATSAVGIVGTRSPSEYGKRWTRRLTHRLVQQQVPIISGMADGIDREAHWCTLEAGGDTVAVLGTGVDVIYPHSNRDLYQRLLSEGLLLSEYPDGTQPDRTHFPRRNRIIAGLSRAILVTEAPSRSGALITARLANDYGRDVYALPGSLDNPRIRGCLELIQQGAQMILEEDTLLSGLGTLPTLDPSPQASPPPNLEPSLQQVYAAVPSEPLHLDRLVQTLTLDTGRVLSALVQLELLGLVTSVPGTQLYQRIG